MPDNEKSLFSKFSIRNPFARIVYASTPLASAFFIELSKHLSNPDEQKVLISALTTAGIIAAPVASVAGNVLAEAISEKFFKRFSRNDILENGDLQKAVGDAICATILAIYDEQQSIFKQKQTGFYDKLKGFFQKEIAIESKSISINKDVLKKLSKVPTETWQKLIEELEKDKDKEFNLTIEEIEALYPRNLPDIFAIPAAKFNEVTALDKNTWEKVLRKLCRLEEIDTSNDKYPHFTHTIAHIAEVLVQNFPELLKHTLVSNIAKNGKAYANLQLKIMGEVLFYVREINNKLDTTNDKLFDIETQISKLREALTDGLSPYSNDFDNQFNEIRNLIIQNQEIIISLLTDLKKDTEILKLGNELLLNEQDQQGKDIKDIQKTGEAILTGAEILIDEVSGLRKDLKTLPKETKIPCKLPVKSFPSPVNFFTGRKTVLENIEKSLKDNKKASLHGTHGLGKSSVAVEFAYRNEKRYSHVFFIRAFGADFYRFVGEIVESLPYKTDEQTTPDQKLAMFQHWLAANENWLLILDNVDDVAEISKHKFTTFGGDVLFTSNKAEIHDIGNEVTIRKMENDEAASLIIRHKFRNKELQLTDVSENDAIYARKIADKFGNSPLAMSFVGSFLAKKQLNLEEFFSRYNQREKNLLETYEFISDYFTHFKDEERKAVATAFLNTFQAITAPKDDSEREVFLGTAVNDYLKICVFLASDEMPEEFFVECLKKLHPSKLAFIEDEDFIDEVKERLYEYAIFERDGSNKTLTTHRLVQEIMSFKIADEENALITLIADTLDENVPYFNYTNHEQVKPYSPHMESFIKYLISSKKYSADITEADNKTIIELSYKIGDYCNLTAQYQKAKKYYLICLNISKKIFGENHKETASFYGNVGNTYFSLNEFESAEKYYQMSLKILLSIFGENHSQVVSNYCNLGNIYFLQADYQKAKEYFKHSLRIGLIIFSDNQIERASLYGNLGNLYASQKNYEKAEKNYQNALKIALNNLGEDNLLTAKIYGNLGSNYFLQGNYQKAEEYFQQDLKIHLKILGKNHPSIATAYNNLGMVYHSQINFIKSEKNHQKALAINLNIFGANHPNTAITYGNLGLLCENLEKLNEAEQYYDEALKIFMIFFPEQHPDIQKTKNNLKRVREKMGK